MLKRVLFFVYGVAAYAVFLGTVGWIATFPISFVT